MKKKIPLLLTLSLAPFLVNCSGKPLQPPSQQPQTHQPIPPKIERETQTHRPPSLGRPISIPRERENTVQPPKPIVPVEQISKHGESYFYKKFKLPSKIDESSGLIKIDNRLWTLNDSGGKAELYQLDERNGHIIKTFKILNAHNRDWEDIAYDENYVYIGDFGNNRGNRRDLRVYKIPRASLRNQKSTRAEVINFHFSDQKSFKSLPQKTNYDCEAMIEHEGKLYLFSKNWGDNKTRLYELSTQAGKHTAQYIRSFNIQGMVTGASINKELKILLLTTYSQMLNVNIWVFTNFNGHDFFKGEAKQLNLKSPLAGQIEGVTFTDNYKAYLSSEAFNKYIFSFDANLYSLDFSGEFE